VQRRPRILEESGMTGQGASARGGVATDPRETVHTRFVDVWGTDPELLALEFEAIVSANALELAADRPERRRPPQKPTTRTARAPLPRTDGSPRTDPRPARPQPVRRRCRARQRGPP
jgi:hypothetical protein